MLKHNFETRHQDTTIVDLIVMPEMSLDRVMRKEKDGDVDDITVQKAVEGEASLRLWTGVAVEMQSTTNGGSDKADGSGRRRQGQMTRVKQWICRHDSTKRVGRNPNAATISWQISLKRYWGRDGWAGWYIDSLSRGTDQRKEVVGWVRGRVLGRQSVISFSPFLQASRVMKFHK